MIKNPSVGQKVWTVFDPSSGLLEFPSEDTITDVALRYQRVLLEKHNHMNEHPYHWSNDYYGNLIEPEYLYETIGEAKEFLLEHYSRLYAKSVAQSYRLRETISKLED